MCAYYVTVGGLLAHFYGHLMVHFDGAVLVALPSPFGHLMWAAPRGSKGLGEGWRS